MPDYILSALFIFVMRIADMTLDTLRVLFMMRGQRLVAGIIGFFQSAIFIIAVSRVMTQLDNPWNIVGYAGGFALGVMVGMTIEGRMAIGFGQMRIISIAQGQAIANALRAKGHGVTELPGRGRDGMVTVLNLTVRRKDIDTVQKMVRTVDDEAFITVEEVRPLWRGFYRA
jgi:uncharacterized protein YebE (UPF0316 family)